MISSIPSVVLTFQASAHQHFRSEVASSTVSHFQESIDVRLVIGEGWEDCQRNVLCLESQKPNVLAARNGFVNYLRYVPSSTTRPTNATTVCPPTDSLTWENLEMKISYGRWSLGFRTDCGTTTTLSCAVLGSIIHQSTSKPVISVKKGITIQADD